MLKLESSLSSCITYIEQQQPLAQKLILSLLVAVIGFIDYITGYELALSLLYVVPVALATWVLNYQAGLATAVVSAIVWGLADVGAGHTYSNPLINIWNTLIRFAFFLIISQLLFALKTQIEHEKNLARTDNLTGLTNARFFYELAQFEIARLERYHHAFSLAYIDLDHFKTVNDKYGHSAGDEALRLVATVTKQHIRKTDIFARLGGDEFALLLPLTSQAEAQAVFAKLQKSLLLEMKQKNWPITFSIGVLTCHVPPLHLKEIVDRADQLMYSVKKEGRNAVKYELYN